MSLDFTALNNIQKQEQGTGTAQEEDEHRHLLTADKRERERVRQLFEIQQKNTERASTLRANIAKDLRQGEPLPAILLQALECISLMTGDTIVYTQGKEDLLAIYGWGLKQPAPLELELNEAEHRLEMLTRPELQEEGTPADAQARIQRAITAHRQRINHIKGLIGGEH